jgi:MFS family permease
LRSVTPRGERQATFREVLASTEFRAIYVASTLSWVGDYLARAAITALVYQITESVVASAAAFAISYAPWLLGGSVLVSLADRYPYRTVMVFCDVGRMVIMGLVAIPGLPLPAVMALLLTSALLTPPFDAARSATLPSILAGDRYVVGVALHGTTAQPAQVAGYFLGAALAAQNPRAALLINALTFGISALLVRTRVGLRQPAADPRDRSPLLRETVDGFRLVFATPALRSLVLVVFCGALLVVVPEGLGAAWARVKADGPGVGLAQGMIMAAAPLGWILGALIVTRFVRPSTRQRLIRPLAIVTAVALVPMVLDPPVAIVAVLAGVSGFAMGGLVPVANGLFVQALPSAYRARAFGVVQGGLHLLQGVAVLVTGMLVHHNGNLALVVGLWSLGGLAAMVLLSLLWPPRHAFAVPDQPELSATPASRGGFSPRRRVTRAARNPLTDSVPGTIER